MKARTLQILFPAAAALAGLAAGLLAPWRGATPESRAVDAPASVQAAAAPGDPFAAAATLALSGGGLRDAARLDALLERLDSTQLASLLTLLERETAMVDAELLAAIVTRWTQRDPTAVSTWMQPRLHARFSRSLLSVESFAILEAWASADPEAALRQAREHPQHALAARLFLAAASGLSDGSPAGRFDVLQKFPPGLARREAIEGLLARWMPDAPPEQARAALALVGRLPAGAEQQSALDLVLPRFAASAPMEALDFAAQAGLENRDTWNRLFRSAAERDGAATAARLEAAGGRMLEDHAATVAAAWLAQDCAAALDWAAARDAMIRRPFDYTMDDRKRLELFGNTFGRTDTYLGAFGDFEYPKPVLQVALERNPGGARDWLQGLPAGPERARWIELAARLGSDEGGPASFVALESLLAEIPPEGAERSLVPFLKKVAPAMPDRVANWAESLPPGPLSIAAWKGLGEAVPELPGPSPGPARDAFLAGQVAKASYVYTNGAIAPAAYETGEKVLFEKLSGIGDLAVRRQTFDNAFQRAVEYDQGQPNPRAAESLDRVPVPDAWKAPWRAKLQAAAIAKGAKGP